MTENKMLEARRKENTAMRCYLFVCWVTLLSSAFAAESQETVVYDDGTGAQISFFLPTHDIWNGKDVEYNTFRISASSNGKSLLLADLTGKKTDDGKAFFGTIIVPSSLVASAEIVLLGGPPNSTMGMSKNLKIRDFRRIVREKSWTEQGKSKEAADDSGSVSSPLFAVSTWANETVTSGGLRLTVVPTRRVWRTTETPSLKVSFSNVSSEQIALLDHFTFDAEGPALIVQIFDPNDPQHCQVSSFDTGPPDKRTTPHWLLVAPKQTLSFTWPLVSKLGPGKHKLQVAYVVCGAADKMIRAAKQKEGSPSLFWTGTIVSEATEIEVQDDATKPSAPKVTDVSIVCDPWYVTFEPSGRAHVQYGQIPGDGGHVGPGTVDFAALLRKVESTPRKEKKEPTDRFQVVVRHEGELSVSAFIPADQTFVQDLLLDLEPKWKQDLPGNRLDDLRKQHPIVEKERKTEEGRP